MMETCSGTREIPHPEIVHDEGPRSCPLCEAKTELRDTDNVNKKVTDEIAVLKEAHQLVCNNLEELRERTKDIKWVIEPVQEAPRE